MTVRLSGSFVPLSQSFSTGPLGILYDSFTLNGVLDPAFKAGYNPRAAAGFSQWYMGMEGDYYDTVDTVHEGYMHYVSSDGSTVPTFRPLFISVAKNAVTDQDAIVVFNVGASSRNAVGGGASFQVKSNAQTLLTLKDSGAFFPTASTSWAMKMGTAFVMALPTDVQASVWAPVWAGGATGAMVANSLYLTAVTIPLPCSITGIQIANGVTSGNAQVAFYNTAGTTLLANSASTALSGGSTSQLIPFTGAYSASPGTYWMGLQPDNATATFKNGLPLASSQVQAQGSYTLPTTITPPGKTTRSAASIPTMATY